MFYTTILPPFPLVSLPVRLDTYSSRLVSMAKRSLSVSALEERPAKRSRRASLPQDHLSGLSDELLLRILSFLPPIKLTECQRYVLPQMTATM